MSDHPKPLNPNLLEEIHKILNLSGELQKTPNLTPTRGSEREQHLPHHEKKAGIIDSMRSGVDHMKGVMANPEGRKALQEVGGLGVLAVGPLDEGQAWARARLAGDKSSEGVEKRQVLPDAGHAAAELGGLAILAHPELHHLRPKLGAAIDELAKLGFVSDDEAARSLQSLKDLENSKPSARQALGYMGIGATAAPIMHMASNALRKKDLLEGVTLGDKLRDAGGQALKGGVGGTAVSIAQQQFDRHHQRGKLKEYIRQHDNMQPKEAGFLDSAKKLLTTPIEGTPTILAGRTPSSPPMPGKAPSDSFKKFQGKYEAMKSKAAGAPRLVGPKMPGLAGSGTPVMPMPKPAALAVG